MEFPVACPWVVPDPPSTGLTILMYTNSFHGSPKKNILELVICLYRKLSGRNIFFSHVVTPMFSMTCNAFMHGFFPCLDIQ